MRSLTCFALLFTLLSLGCVSLAQQTSTAVPNLVNYSGVLKDSSGTPLSAATTGVTFAIYKQQDGGAPIWLETQNVTAEPTGHYTVLLGSTKAEGIPAELFSTQEQRWLGVQVQGQEEQTRVLLVSVPYAMKASDAATVGGLPASAFMLAPLPSSPASAAVSSGPNIQAVLPPLGGTGTTDFLPLWTNSTTLGTSVLFQLGSGSTAKVGINTTSPGSTLDVNGAGTIRGLFKLPATGTATATIGKNSQAEGFVASAFSSTTNAAVNQTFQWQAEPAANNTSSPSGTLNLLFGSGTATPIETGLKLSNKGLFTFAAGQKFPGTGTITGVTAGTDLTGGGTSGTVTLNLDTTKVPQLSTANTFTANQTVQGTVTGTSFSGNGAALTNVNAARLGGLAVGAFAQLAAANTFTHNQLITGTGNAFSLVVHPPNATTGSGLPGSPAIDAIGSSADPNGLKAGGVGLTASGGVGGALNVSGKGGDAIDAVGGDAGNGNGGVGISASGGFGVGGDSVSVGSGGPGVLARGGDSQLFFGGDGINATGGAGGVGNNFASTAGNGVVGTGGAGGFQEADGDGGFFTGGTAGGFGGFGIEVFAGSDSAAFFSGDIIVTGAISAGIKDFKIDHPLDPANKYLYHGSVESSEMMNIYTGNITTDAQGDALVQLPQWFEAVNGDFRYQLTVIGQFAQAIVSSRVANHQFAIKTDKPNVDVSWQITAVRQDAFAKAHPLVVEVSKIARERGFYLHPEVYGAPPEKGIAWTHHPQAMRSVKALQQHKNSARTLMSSR